MKPPRCINIPVLMRQQAAYEASLVAAAMTDTLLQQPAAASIAATFTERCGFPHWVRRARSVCGGPFVIMTHTQQLARLAGTLLAHFSNEYRK